MEILTKRPKEMSFSDYRKHMKLQSRWLYERCSRSVTYYVSWREAGKDNMLTTRIEEKRYITRPPFRGSVRRDLTRPA